jgi:spore coat protein U-like protein
LFALSGPASAGTATANLTVQVSIAAACTINASTLDFGSVAGTSLVSSPTSASAGVSVTCTNTSPYSIGMDNGLSYSTTRRMAGGGNYIPYGLYVDAAHTQAWTTATSSTSCAAAGSCYLGTGTGTAQTVNVYGLISVLASAPAPGAYSDTVAMTITY